jgi:ABC-type nitrate/sulfonate/bicarbonate transport system substrate-binding protein
MAMIGYCMEQEGASFDDLTLIPNDITDEPAALAAHQTDAVWVFYGWSGVNAEIEGVHCAVTIHIIRRNQPFTAEKCIL